jgi:hypothetical protein
VRKGRPFRHAGGKTLVEAGGGIEAGADGGAALRQRVNVVQALDDAAAPGDEGGDVAGKFLAQRERRRVLRMGAADLDDVGKGGGLFLQGGDQMVEAGQERCMGLAHDGDVDRGREGVVGRLAHIDVVVGMDGRLGAHLSAHQLDGAVGDHLVGVHVGLRAGAGLPDDEREIVVEPAVDDFLGGLDDPARALRVEDAERKVRLGGGALDEAECVDERQRHLLGADTEILDRALRLRAPIAVCGHVDRAERVGLGAGVCHAMLPELVGIWGIGAAVQRSDARPRTKT